MFVRPVTSAFCELNLLELSSSAGLASPGTVGSISLVLCLVSDSPVLLPSAGVEWYFGGIVVSPVSFVLFCFVASHWWFDEISVFVSRLVEVGV